MRGQREVRSKPHRRTDVGAAPVGRPAIDRLAAGLGRRAATGAAPTSASCGYLATGVGARNSGQAYSARRASSGETELARIAGISAATSADSPSAITAARV